MEYCNQFTGNVLKKDFFDMEKLSVGKGSCNVKPCIVNTLNRTGEWEFTYKVGAEGVKSGGSVRIDLQKYCTHTIFYDEPQAKDPLISGFIKVACSRENVELKPIIINKPQSLKPFVTLYSIEAFLESGSLVEGDELYVTYGYGSGAKIEMTFSINLEMVVSVDVKGDRDFVPVLNCPRIRFEGYEAKALEVFLPSGSVVEKKVDICIAAYTNNTAVLDDKSPFKHTNIVKNRACGYRGKIKIYVEGSEAKTIGDYTFNENDRGLVRISTTFNKEGIYRVRVVDEENGFEALSNSIEVFIDHPEEKIFWGDIHSHSELSHAYNTAEDIFDSARNVSFLDFCSLSEEMFNIEKATELGDWQKQKMKAKYLHTPQWVWSEMNKAIKKCEAEGEFVIIPGYEWSNIGSAAFGHRNVYYLNEENLPILANIYPEEMYHKLKEVKDGVMVIPHHTGYAIGSSTGFDWSRHDPELERHVEIYSLHGCSEKCEGNPRPLGNNKGMGKSHPGTQAVDALNRGFKLGFTGGSDDHSSTLGRGAGYGKGDNDGLLAVFTDKLDRKSVWDAIYNRRCYGTTGARIILKFEADGMPMGTEQKRSESPTFKVHVVGTSPLKRVEIIKNEKVMHYQNGNSYALDFEVTDRSFEAKKENYYYVRVIQEDGEMAWSSPIWIDNENVTQSLKTLDFVSVGDDPVESRRVMSVKNEKEFYVSRRKIDDDTLNFLIMWKKSKSTKYHLDIDLDVSDFYITVAGEEAENLEVKDNHISLNVITRQELSRAGASGIYIWIKVKPDDISKARISLKIDGEPAVCNVFGDVVKKAENFEIILSEKV